MTVSQQLPFEFTNHTLPSALLGAAWRFISEQRDNATETDPSWRSQECTEFEEAELTLHDLWLAALVREKVCAPFGRCAICGFEPCLCEELTAPQAREPELISIDAPIECGLTLDGLE